MSFDFPEPASAGSIGQAPNREELLQLAIRTARGGNVQAARVMFRQVLAQDRRNERAMMWMAKLAANKTERQQWLTRVLRVNPNNETARTALRRMQYRKSANENRQLLLYGTMAGVMMVIGIVILAVVFVASG